MDILEGGVVSSNTTYVLLHFSLKMSQVPRVQNVIIPIIKRSTFSYLQCLPHQRCLIPLLRKISNDVNDHILKPVSSRLTDISRQARWNYQEHSLQMKRSKRLHFFPTNILCFQFRDAVQDGIALIVQKRNVTALLSIFCSFYLD